ncbi:unnamed protein product [Sphagnum troendelagicum]|uniref:Uncharacterized protein n=1 Tax=Sphagnum troendelagicum TaxID=128251 RepID=A0ABP0TT39_9BRYO
MNGVVMLTQQAAQASGYCYRHVSYSRGAESSSSRSLRTLLLSSSSLAFTSKLKTSSIGALKVSGLGQSRPLKKIKHVAVHAVAETDLNGTFRGSQKQTKEVIMVDPLEAKRLAAAEWKLLQARAALQRQQQIEAINGGWAVLGLTIAIIIEGYTGNSIPEQVAGYLDSIADFLARLIPGP